MKLKPIIADPMALDRAGIVTNRQSAILIHIGRCGLLGTTIPHITKSLKISGNSVTAIVAKLCELSLITGAWVGNSQGRPRNYVCTVRGWNLLTQPADFSMFPHSQIALEKHAHKTNRETPPENETPAAAAAGIDMGKGSADDCAEDAAADPDAERPAAALGGETPGNEGGPRQGEAGHLVGAAGSGAAAGA